MAELVYAYGLGPYPARVGGSSPLRPTILNQLNFGLIKNMASAIERQDDGTIKFIIVIPRDLIKKTRLDVLGELVKNANIAGFRKGKAPKKLIEEKTDKEKVKEEILKKLLPNAYARALEEHNVKPVISPRIHVEKLEDDKDWEFTALTCEAPEIELNGYKEAIKKVTAKSKIIIAGKEPQPPSFDEIVGELLKSVQVKIADIIIEQEVERLLSQTLSEIKKLGLTLERYLASTGKTADSLKDEYRNRAENDIKLEFILSKIAEEEKITISNEEINEAIQKAKDDGERKNLEENRYLLASILRQQKTLDFLKNL